MSALADPCPADVVLDFTRLVKLAGDYMAEDKGWHHDLEHNRLSWTLEGFDPEGFASVTVMHSVTGQVVATGSIHWRALTG